jgi:hypothetical protein
VTVPWQQARDLPGPPVNPDSAGRADPVIVLTYGHAGAWFLQRLLQDEPELAATSATGLLAACDAAAAAWRSAEQRPEGKLPPLARASIRAMALPMMTSITARAGRPRWFEIASSGRSAAETFLELFPGTRFVCLHRASQDAIYATLQASPWGLTGQAYAAYTASYPGSKVAALAAWWAGHTEPILEFEQEHPEACMRLRYEDLVADSAGTGREIREFLGLNLQALELPELPGDLWQALAGADAPGCGADFPAGQIPPVLLAQVNELHEQLGYPPLKARS